MHYQICAQFSYGQLIVYTCAVHEGWSSLDRHVTVSKLEYRNIFRFGEGAMALSDVAAAREHTLAATRDYITQPRLSELISWGYM